MSRQLTITLPDDVYDRLQDRFGADQISSFIEKLLTPYVVTDEQLEADTARWLPILTRARGVRVDRGAPNGALDSEGVKCTGLTSSPRVAEKSASGGPPSS